MPRVDTLTVTTYSPRTSAASELWPEEVAAEIERVDAFVCHTHADVARHVETLPIYTGFAEVAVSRSPVVSIRDGGLYGIAGYYDAPSPAELYADAKRQLMLSLFDDEQLDRWIEGCRALAEEFSP